MRDDHSPWIGRLALLGLVAVGACGPSDAGAPTTAPAVTTAVARPAATGADPLAPSGAAAPGEVPPEVSYLGQPTTTTTTAPTPRPAASAPTPSTSAVPPSTTSTPTSTTPVTVARSVVLDEAVLFASGECRLDEAGPAALVAAVADSGVLDVPEVTIRVDAYVDDRGTPEANLSLASCRGDVVVDVLVGTWPDLGARVRAVAHGEDDLPTPCRGDCPENRVVHISSEPADG